MPTLERDYRPLSIAEEAAQTAELPEAVLHRIAELRQKSRLSVREDYLPPVKTLPISHSSAQS